MAEVIASVSLFVSVLLLIVHYRNQVERRHGEIAKLRSEILTRLSNTHHRMASMQLHVETMRLEIRRVPECDKKYDLIEKMPQVIEEMNEGVRRLKEIQNYYEEMDTTKTNRSSDLIFLQSVEHNFRDMEIGTEKLEQETLEIITSIRSIQERVDQEKIV